MKVLITGGTGFLGWELAKALKRENYQVKMLVRKTSNIAKLQGEGFELVFGDITDKKSLDGIAKDIDVVYHLAAQIGKWGVSENAFEKVNVQGTKNLLESCINTGQIRQFIFCSTLGVQGKGYAEAKEEFPYNPPYAYERSKCEAEKLAIEFHRDRNLPVTIIRPDFVYGPGDFRRISLYRAIQRRRFFIIGDGRACLHPTYIDDVIDGFIKATVHQEAIGQIFNIAGPETISVRRYVNTIARALNVKVWPINMPLKLGRTAALFFESLSTLNRKEPFVSRSRIDFLTIDHGSNIAKARSVLGFDPRFDFYRGFQHTRDWAIKNNLI